MRKNAFTLIELLVAISIIAVLSVIGLALYQGVQAKARDSVRKRDLQNLALALEIYFQQNDKYVVNANDTDITACQTDPNPQNNRFYDVIRAKMSDGVVPTDPPSKQAYCYLSSNNGQSFTLCAKLENPELNNLAPSTCPATEYNYGVIPK